MAIVLSNIQERVERSLFKALETVLVETEYGVSKADFTNDANGAADYQAALEAIATAKGFAIELFGASGIWAKENKRVARIAIIPDSIQTGDLGTPPGFQFGPLNEQDNVYPVITGAPTTSDLQYEVRTVYNTIKQDRILNAIIGFTLSTRKYITLYDNAEEVFFIQRLGSVIYPNSDFGLGERINRYQVKDVYEFSDQIAREVVPIDVIKLNTILASITQDEITPPEEITIPVP